MEEDAADVVEFQTQLTPHSIKPDCAVCGRTAESCKHYKLTDSMFDPLRVDSGGFSGSWYRYRVRNDEIAITCATCIAALSKRTIPIGSFKAVQGKYPRPRFHFSS